MLSPTLTVAPSCIPPPPTTVLSCSQRSRLPLAATSCSLHRCPTPYPRWSTFRTTGIPCSRGSTRGGRNLKISKRSIRLYMHHAFLSRCCAHVTYILRIGVFRMLRVCHPRRRRCLLSRRGVHSLYRRSRPVDTDPATRRSSILVSVLLRLVNESACSYQPIRFSLPKKRARSQFLVGLLPAYGPMPTRSTVRGSSIVPVFSADTRHYTETTCVVKFRRRQDGGALLPRPKTDVL